MIIPTAEPFYFSGGKIGVLLVHGFTGTPKEMRWMGEYLNLKGYSVLGVRLAGHATNPEDLMRVRWKDWLLSIEDGYHLLKGWSEKIFIAGFSMGGVLTLLFSSKIKVSGLVTMSTPYELPSDPRLRFINILWRIIPTIQKGESDWVDSSLDKDHISYPQYITRAIIELNEAVTEMQSSLPGITSPTLLFHSEKDKSVPYNQMKKIYDHLGCKDKNMISLNDSGHVIVRDLQKSIVFDSVHSFIQRIMGNP
jgi:carboxylesterase